MLKEIELIKRGVVDLISEEELVKKIKEKKSLRVKFGADPTAPDIHLGHVVVLKKLRQFQDLGHTVYFIIGDFTAMIGDPSGRSQTRPILSKKEIDENAKTYERQIFKVLRKEKTVIVRNSEWFLKMDVRELLKLISTYTVSKMLEREDFKNRYKNGLPISILEFIYPLLQGYDSVYLKADVEIGGEDQIFNLLTAREIQRAYGVEEQVVLTLPLLEGTDGVKKMSKSLGNYIGIDEDAIDIFGKLMSIPDSLLEKYITLLTNMKYDEKKHPKELKKELAFCITEEFKGKGEAIKAKEHFERVFEKREIPDELEEKIIEEGKYDIAELLFKIKAVPSKSEAKRIITQGGVKIDGRTVESFKEEIEVKDGIILKVGKRKFYKLKVI